MKKPSFSIIQFEMKVENRKKRAVGLLATVLRLSRVNNSIASYSVSPETLGLQDITYRQISSQRPRFFSKEKKSFTTPYIFFQY
jgi:hypothetical protein